MSGGGHKQETPRDHRAGHLGMLGGNSFRIY